MKGRLIHIKENSFLGQIENHSIVFDEGKNSVSPMQALLLSLAGCTAMDVWNIMIKKRQKLKNLEIEVEGKRRDTYPRVFTEIKLKYIFYGDVDEKTCEKSIKLSMEKYCSISNMLKNAVDIKTSFEII